MNISEKDKSILRKLAEELATIAAALSQGKDRNVEADKLS